MHLPDFDDLDADTVTLIEGAMPKSMAALISAIGLKLTLEFVDAFAGQSFVVPKRQHGQGAPKFARIEDAIGAEAALIFIEIYGGESFDVPRCTKVEAALRNREIVRDFDAATKVTSAINAVNDLATRYRLSWRQIEMIVNHPATQ